MEGNIGINCCPTCGNNRRERFKKEDRGYTCQACGSWISNETVERENEALKKAFKGVLDEGKLEQIANLRSDLSVKLDEDDIDSEEIVRICKEIKKYLSYDFRANFYETVNSGNKTRINNFLDKIDVKEQRDFIPEVLNFMIKSLKKEYFNSVKSLLNRAYETKDTTHDEYAKIAGYYEEEAKKVGESVYDPDYPRDAFILYSSKDTEVVTKLVNHLEAQGFSCFVAFRNLQHGIGAVRNYQDYIYRAIDSCTAVIMVSTINSRSYGCDAVELEIKYIEHKEKDYPPEKRRKPRIEYRVGKAKEEKVAGDVIVKNFFEGYTYVRNIDDVSNALMEIRAEYRSSRVETMTATKSTPTTPTTPSVPTDTVYIDSEVNLTSGEEEFNLPEFTDVSDDENDGKQIKSKRTKGEKTIENIDKETRKKEFWGESHNAFLFGMCVMFAIASVALLFPGTQLFSILAIASGMVTIVTAIIALGSVGDDIAYIEVEVGTLIFFGVVAVVTVIVGLVQWIGLYGII